MMTKKEHIDYWKDIAELDWNRVLRQFEQSDYVFALFCLQMQFEKLAKALWVKQNVENIPPRVHDIIAILNETNLELTEDDIRFLYDLNRYQLEGRYPDYRKNIYKITSRRYADEMINKGKIFKAWIEKALQ
ncbi:MAG: HEPN domain-containing protein [Chitinophagales bacterium]|nr:HEPN domain-containing protein [Chitinophagales bacterium]